MLDQVHVWDDVTAEAVLARLAPPNRGSSPRPDGPSPSRCWTCRSRRDGELSIPVPALIDIRLAIGETDGYDDLPEAGQSWRDKLAHIRHQISHLAVLHPDHRGVLSAEHPALATVVDSLSRCLLAAG